MHGTDFLDTLSDFFSAPVLPPEYGGEGPGIEKACQDWTNELLNSENILQQIATHPTGDIAITPEDSLISEVAQTKQISEAWISLLLCDFVKIWVRTTRWPLMLSVLFHGQMDIWVYMTIAVLFFTLIEMLSHQTFAAFPFFPRVSSRHGFQVHISFCNELESKWSECNLE